MTATVIEPVDGAGTRERILDLSQRYGVYVALAVLIAVATALNTDFMSVSNWRVQMFEAAPTVLVALGMALVIGTEGVDLSVGATIALAASIIPLYIGYGPAPAIVLALLLGAASGLVGGSMVAFAGVQPIVATLSLMIGVRGLAELLNGSSAKPVADSTIADLGEHTLAGIPLMAWIALATTAVVAYTVRRTTFGRQLVAIGDNKRASLLAGLPVRRVLVTVYVLSGILAALAGVLIVGHGAEADPANQGLNMELSAITAVVVGGTPLSGGRVRVVGTAAGAMFMQLISAVLIQHNVPTSTTQIVEAVLICLAVYVSRERGTR